MIGLALSGGGSRAMAFHLGCLRALNDLEILQKIGVLSTISGGSVIGAYYAFTPNLTFDEFEVSVRGILRAGFQSRMLRSLLHPRNFFPGLLFSGLAHAQDAIAIGTSYKSRIPRLRSRTDLLDQALDQLLFRGLDMASPTRDNLQIVIGACELRTGTAFRFGNKVSGSWRHGTIINKIPVSFATAASAAYPIFLPSFDRQFQFRKNDKTATHRVALTDGGVYDNLGIQVLEPGRNPKISLHTFPCEYIIACNAGQGQESGQGMPMGIGSRVKRAFEVVHRRVQDGAMHHLHALKSSDRLKGFAMPYLGQLDDSLPWKPSPLVPREGVIGYPTNFGAMPDVWIDRLSDRGEQLTRALVTHYIPQLLA